MTVKNCATVSGKDTHDVARPYQSGQHEIIVNQPWQLPDIPRDETQDHGNSGYDNEQNTDGDNARALILIQMCLNVRHLRRSRWRREVGWRHVRADVFLEGWIQSNGCSENTVIRSYSDRSCFFWIDGKERGLTRFGLL